MTRHLFSLIGLMVALVACDSVMARDTRLELRAGLETSSGERIGRARFDLREDRIRIRVEVEGLSAGAEIAISVGPSTFVVVVDSSGRGEVEIDSREDDGLPSLEPGALLVVSAGGTELFAGDFGKRGDANSDTSMDISDAVTILIALFVSAQRPIHWAAADGNDDTHVDIADALWVLERLFRRDGSSGGDDSGDDGDDAGECEGLERFLLDVDGDGRREDGHIRTRRRDDRDDLEVEVGPLEVDSVTILLSDDGDAANAYFSGMAPVLADGDAELELEHGLPQPLDDMVGDSVFVRVGEGEAILLGAVPAPRCDLDDNGDDNGGDDGNDNGDDDCEARAEFDLDVDGDGLREDGHIRTRRRDGHDDLEVEVGPLEVDSVTIILSDDGDAANAYFSGVAPVLADGDAELELEHGLPQPLDDMVGDSVFVRIGDGAPVFLGLVPAPACAGGDDGGNSGPGGGDGDCEGRAGFDLDVDGDGRREDGHIRTRRREDRDDLEVEVGPLEVDSVTILLSDDGDAANAYFSRVVPVLATRDAELELEHGLPQPLGDMVGDSVFVQVGDAEPVLLGLVPATGCEGSAGGDDNGGGDNGGDDNGGENGGGECDVRNRFDLDVDGDGVREDGSVRARRRDGAEDLEVEVGVLEVDAVTILLSDDGDASNAYFSALAPVLATGDAELQLEDGLPQSLDDMAGDSVFVRVGDAAPVFLTTVPGCN